MADPTQTQITQTSIPDYAKPYVEEMLGKAQALTDINQNPYMQYQGDRIAQFTPLQQQAFERAAAMESASQLQDATAMAQQAGLAALKTGYAYNPYAAQQVSGSELERANFQYDPYAAERVSSSYTYDPYKASQVSAPTIGAAPEMTAAMLNYRPEVNEYQMGPAEQVGTRSVTDSGVASRYMSPYMQNVVDVQMQQAKRQADIAAQTQQAQAARAGAFGGGRDVVQRSLSNAENQRILANLQAAGLQNAYQQGMQQFNTEQQAAMQAAMANQQAGLTVGQQNLAAKLSAQGQRLNAEQQVALANLNAEQQARVQNQAAKLQMQGLSAQQALQAAIANQQAEQGAAALNFQQGQFGANLGLQTGIANQQAAQAAAALNAQQNQFGANLFQQGSLANQQNSLQAAMANQQAAQAAAALNAQQEQFGAGLKLQGLQTANQVASNLANIGNTQFNQDMGVTSLQSQLGAQQQQQEQNLLNNQYQDFLNYQNYPYQQMSFMSNLLRGLPMTNTTSQVYQQPPSMLSQVAGAGITAKALGAFKKGGRVKSNGLAGLALAKMA